MNRKSVYRRATRMLGLMAFIATGGGLIVSTAIHEGNYYKTEILIIFGSLFAISLIDHFKNFIERNDEDEES